ncbi:S-layer homology domain-containing protein [bacterium]|nr:S-layer homology domain-containing protein [bacterium]
MKNFIKLLLPLITALMLSAPTFAYSDVAANHWAAKQIEILTEQGVVVGYPDGTFQPDENVTRAEFASMAIKALGQEHTTVAQPVNFTDIEPSYWAYDAIQKALFFDLVSCPLNGEPFRPEDPVSRAESISVAVNALTTQQISLDKAKEVLAKKYSDADTIPEWFVVPAGKAEILNMIISMPSATNNIEALRPATRAEVAAILYEMRHQALLNPNAKLADAMRKKKGEGFVVKDAFVQGSIGTIPAGAIVPVYLTKYTSSQQSDAGEIYTATAAENFVTPESYILVRQGANLKGQLLDVRKGQWFVRNGVLVLDNSLITTVNDQTAEFKAVCEITKYRNRFMRIVRAVLKGEKLEATPNNMIYMKLLKPVRVDLTNGWILE